MLALAHSGSLDLPFLIPFGFFFPVVRLVDGGFGGRFFLFPLPVSLCRNPDSGEHTHPAQTERGLVVLPRRPTDREFFKLASSILRVRQHPRDSKTRSSHSCSTPDALRSRFYTARPIFGRHPPYQKDRPAICTLMYR